VRTGITAAFLIATLVLAGCVEPNGPATYSSLRGTHLPSLYLYGQLEPVAKSHFPDVSGLASDPLVGNEGGLGTGITIFQFSSAHRASQAIAELPQGLTFGGSITWNRLRPLIGSTGLSVTSRWIENQFCQGTNGVRCTDGDHPGYGILLQRGRYIAAMGRVGAMYLVPTNASNPILLLQRFHPLYVAELRQDARRLLRHLPPVS
jgi:hypothetical protein